MKKNFVKRLTTVMSMCAIIGSQTLSVCAAPASDIPVVSKENLLRYYEENFDVAKYKATYKDLVDAFGVDAPDSVYLNHYLEYGMTEGRKSGGFDAIAFIINNYDYFMEHGMEDSFPFFDVQKYKAEYPDLQAAFGDDLTAYLNHYLTFGIYENRASGGEVDIIQIAKLNPNMDLATNIDLSKAPTVITEVVQQVKAAETQRVAIVQAAQSAVVEEQTVYLGGTVVKDPENKVYYNYEAYNKAVQNWIKDEPYIDEYLAETDYFDDYWAWESQKPDINGYLTVEGQEAYNNWMNAQPDYWEYLMQTGFKDEYEAWQDSTPQRQDFTVGYENEEAAQEAFETDHAEWVASQPQPEDYPDMVAFSTAMTTWENREPVEADFPFFEDGFTSEDVARAAYQEELSRWEAGKPVAESDAEYQARLEAYENEHPAPKAEDYVYHVNRFESQDDADDAFETAQTNYNNAVANWDGQDAPTEDTYLSEVGTTYATEEEARAAFNADKAEWDIAQGDAPNAEEYKYVENTYGSAQEAADALTLAQNNWNANKPVAETPEEYQAKVDAYTSTTPAPVEDDYTSKVNQYETQLKATEAFIEAQEAWLAEEPQQENYLSEEDYNDAMATWSEAEPTIDNGNYEVGDYATEEEAEEAYMNALDEHGYNMPVGDGYIGDTTYSEDYKDWLDAEPDLTDEFVPDDNGNNYEDLITEWEATEPNYEEYLDDTDYEADHQEWVNHEPKLEDFTNADGSVG